MEIVIKIDKDYYEMLKHEVEHGHDFKPYNLIANGTPLPKGHGDLIDFQDLKNKYLLGGYIEMSSYDINNVPTIIEADKE